jgi:hypothetical protein
LVPKSAEANLTRAAEVEKRRQRRTANGERSSNDHLSRNDPPSAYSTLELWTPSCDFLYQLPNVKKHFGFEK